MGTGGQVGLGAGMPLIMLIIIGVVIYMAYKKKKQGKEANPFLSNRKNKDEVWKTIKQFLKDNDEKGKELVDSYVVKRNHVDMIDPNGSILDRKNKNIETKIRKWQRDQINKNSNKKVKAPLARDVFVVIFKTKDTKTGIEDSPRAIECEVINTKIDKKNFDRKIVINGELDYDQEMEWIAPVKAAEEAKAAAVDKRIAKQKEAQAKQEKRRLERAQKKAQKKNAKNSKK